MPYEIVRAECPFRLAKYITLQHHSSNDQIVKRYGRSARHLLRKIRRVCRRLSNIFDDSATSENEKQKKVRKKPGVNKRVHRKEKYGITIPSKYADVVELDVANGNTLWQTAVQTELAALIDHDCF